MVYSTRYDKDADRQISDRTDRSPPDLFVPGVIFDIDPEFNNTEEWWLSIPEEVRPHKDQPFYHLLAENSESEYVAYVSEQNLLPDDSGEPIRHSQVAEIFVKDKSGGYRPRNPSLN